MVRHSCRWWGLAEIPGRAVVKDGGAVTTKSKVRKLLEESSREFPRLFLSKGAEEHLREKLDSDELLKKASDSIIERADTFMEMEPVARTLTGRRLLGVSRTALERICYLSYAYRIAGDSRYGDRAKLEMLAAASFEDWNPNHFLDVAEMTAALAIGLDWCHDALDDGVVNTIKTAIIEKGLKPSLEPDNGAWNTARNNWNQVCHAGMIMGALMTWEDEPQLATQMIERGVNNVPCSMREYAPDGAYPEGPTYWTYGTSFNVMLIAALESALGTDFGLTSMEGFSETPDYYQHASSPGNRFFNYSDCSVRGGVSPSMQWFAARLGKSSLLWRERQIFEEREAQASGRLFPLLVVWAGKFGKIDPPAKLHWHGNGLTPVAFHRSSWTDPDAAFVAIKGGSPSANHAHMDVGTFVMDADGIRWASDLGSEGYHKIESLGMNLWGREQGADRWQIFRLGSTSHNILTVDGKEQVVEGHAPIAKFCEDINTPHTIIDLSPVYQGDLSKATRGVALRPDGSVLIQDEIEGVRDATVRWAMVTPANVEITSDTTAMLTQEGKMLGFTVLSPAGVKIKIYPINPPPNSYDSPNEGTCMIGFEVPVSSASEHSLAVVLSPRTVGDPDEKVVAISNW